MATCPHDHGGDLNSGNNDDRSKEAGDDNDSDCEAVKVVAKGLNIWMLVSVRME